MNTWRPMETAPIAEEGNFLVERGPDQARKWIEEVFAFQGEIYPARMIDGIDHNQRVLDAKRWRPLPDEENFNLVVKVISDFGITEEYMEDIIAHIRKERDRISEIPS